MRKLSAYTIADNCTDIADCNTGLEELRAELNKQNANPPRGVYTRYAKLTNKLQALTLAEKQQGRPE